MNESKSVSQENKMLILGLAGAGCQILSRVAPESSPDMKIGLIDTDPASLDASAISSSLQIGNSVTKGFSAGGNTLVGRRAVEADLSIIREMIKGVSFLVLVVGLGGGTGSGAAPAIIRIARSQGSSCLCLATTPFNFEGHKKMSLAKEALDQLQHLCDAVVVLPNQILANQLQEEPSLEDSFRLSDEMLKSAVQSLWKLFHANNLLQLDFAAVKNMVNRFDGLCHFGCATSSKSHKLVGELIKHPLMENGEILRKCQAVVFGLCAGKGFKLSQMDEIVDDLFDYLPKDTQIQWGIALDSEESNELSLTVVASESIRAPENEDGNPSDEKGSSDDRGQSKLDLYPVVSEAEEISLEQSRGEDLDKPTYLRRGTKIPH